MDKVPLSFWTDLIMRPFKDVPTREIKGGEVLGVPQRTFAYLKADTSQNKGFDSLSTGNVAYCVFLAGHNNNGIFLTHLDTLTWDKFPKMMDRVSQDLGEDFDMTIVTRGKYDENSKKSRGSVLCS